MRGAYATRYLIREFTTSLMSHVECYALGSQLCSCCWTLLGHKLSSCNINIKVHNGNLSCVGIIGICLEHLIINIHLSWCRNFIERFEQDLSWQCLSERKAMLKLCVTSSDWDLQLLPPRGAFLVLLKESMKLIMLNAMVLRVTYWTVNIHLPQTVQKMRQQE